MIVCALLPIVAGSLPARAQGASPLRLADEPALRAAVSVEAANRPLSEALADLAKQANVDLGAEKPVGRQRVTLHLTGQALSRVMARLSGLLSHAPEGPAGYYWEKLERPAGRRPGYRLWRTQRSRREEELELDYPRRKGAQMLRDVRKLLVMSPTEQAAQRLPPDNVWLSSSDLAPYRDAIAGLSDADLDTLAERGRVPLAPGRCAEQVEAYNRAWRGQAVQRRDFAASHSMPDPYPEGIPAAPPDAPALRFQPNDEEGARPEFGPDYYLGLAGVTTLPGSDLTGTMSVGFDPYRDAETPLPEPKDRSAPIYDLTPLLSNPAVTREQRGDIGFTLRALAKIAGINLFAETFYQPKRFGGRSQGIRLLRGPLPQLLNAICAEWRYRVEKVGEDYVLWSITWARDRSFDIPEELLDGWRAREAKQSGLTLSDKFDLVSALTWPQICTTLDLAFESSGPWNNGRRFTDIYRFCGRFDAAERRQLARGGLTLEAMEPAQRQALVEEVMGRTAADSTELKGAYLELTYDDAFQSKRPEPGLPVQRRAWLAVRLPAGNSIAPAKTLWQSALFYTATSPAP